MGRGLRAIWLLGLALLCAGGASAEEATPAPEVTPPAVTTPPPPPAGPSPLGPFFDRMPMTLEGTLMAPVAPLAMWLGWELRAQPTGEVALYQPEAKQAIVELFPGNKQARLHTRSYELPVAPQTMSDRLYAPLRFLVEAAGFWVRVERHTVILELPQENLKVLLALPPDPASHQAKIWSRLGLWYGLPPDALPVDTTSLPHWNLYSQERKRELIAQIGRDVPTLLEAHWGARKVKGIRIVSDATDPEGGAAAVQVLVKYEDGGVYADDFSFVLEGEGWRVRRQSSAQVAGG